jgi:hypothetical protein
MNHKQNKLIKDVEKKCTTIMIGAIARFENIFGYLWEKEDEKGNYYHDLWQQARQEILNFGNHQSREAVENMYKFFIQEKNNTRPYSYEFRFKNDKQGEQE